METKKIIFGVLLFVVTMSILGYFMRYRLLEGTPWDLNKNKIQVEEPMDNTAVDNPVAPIEDTTGEEVGETAEQQAAENIQIEVTGDGAEVVAQ